MASESEAFALAVLQPLLQDSELWRVCEEGNHDKPDFRSPRHAVEVKEVTSEGVRSLQAAIEAHGNAKGRVRSTRLRHHWLVLPGITDAAAEFSGVEGPSIKTMARNLVPLLEQIEAHDRHSMNAHRAWQQIHQLIGRDGNCWRCDPLSAQPGITIQGHSRATAHQDDIELVADLLQKWLNSPFAQNLSDSLENEDTGPRKIGALILACDGPAASSMWALMMDHPDPATVPATRLHLPDHVDAIYAISMIHHGDRRHVIEFDAQAGWRRHIQPAF
ncbi:hypothetical protein [Mycobacteroides abscessus]|uniref:hypothetical protein n=1 Tax=Mycobacteroides abscessus TaxID=36809 RepID=UPI0012FFE4A3|nr:hypothetical protein [Mycobacteroides abscessus]